MLSSAECSPLKMLLEINRTIEEDADGCKPLSSDGHSEECEDMNKKEATIVRLNLLCLARFMILLILILILNHFQKYKRKVPLKEKNAGNYARDISYAETSPTKNRKSAVRKHGDLCVNTSSQKSLHDPNQSKPETVLEPAKKKISPEIFNVQSDNSPGTSYTKESPSEVLHSCSRDINIERNVVAMNPPIEQRENDVVLEPITCIPSTERVGIPFSVPSNMTSLPSMDSKDPSPVIKCSKFTISKDQMKKISTNLSPELKKRALDNKSMKFYESLLRNKKNGKETYSVSETQNCRSEPILGKLQEFFNTINSSIVLEVDEVEYENDVNIRRTILQETKSDNQKSWLSNLEKSSVKQIVSKNVTNADIAVQMSEVANCLVTEADSSGLAMEIKEYNNTPEDESMYLCHKNNIFNSILEESRLAGMKSLCLQSTPTKENTAANFNPVYKSPFIQYLSEIGGDKTSPIKDHSRALTVPNKISKSRLIQDSGLGLSLNIPIPTAIHKTSPSQQQISLKDDGPSSVKDLSSTSGAAEIEDYYNKLLKTPVVPTCSQSHGVKSNLDSDCSQNIKPNLPELELRNFADLIKDLSSPKENKLLGMFGLMIITISFGCYFTIEYSGYCFKLILLFHISIHTELLNIYDKTREYDWIRIFHNFTSKW